MDKTEQILRQKYDEIDRETRARTQELSELNASLQAEIEHLKKNEAEWRRAEEAQRFLANAVSVLATSLDYKSTLENLARLAIPRLADSCAVFMLERHQKIRRLAVIDSRGLVPDASDKLETILPLDRAPIHGPAKVVRSGEHELAAEVTDLMLESLGFQPAQFGPDRGRPVGYLCVPLTARGRTVGAMALISTTPGRTFDAAVLSLSLDLGRAAGLAMDNARLYREAQEANRLKDEFVAMVSHELRTPLTPILGCVHLLRNSKLTEANFARALDMIERNAQAQAQIVEDLVDVSRIVAGKLHLDLKAIDIVPVVEAAIESVRWSAETKSIEIVQQIENVGNLIDGDRTRLQQVIWNLLSNAVKFTPPGGQIIISVHTHGDHVRIQVTDTGIGISPELLPYIFDAFRQAEVPEAPMVRPGLGLGLAIVRHLVELHNGFIEAASPGAGRGAVFTLNLPLQARKAAHAGS